MTQLTEPANRIGRRLGIVRLTYGYFYMAVHEEMHRDDLGLPTRESRAINTGLMALPLETRLRHEARALAVTLLVLRGAGMHNDSPRAMAVDTVGTLPDPSPYTIDAFEALIRECMTMPTVVSKAAEMLAWSAR